MAKVHVEHDMELFASKKPLVSIPRFYRKPNGSTCWLQARKKVIEFENGEFGIFGITTDVSEQQEKEKN